jgi:hypothetical protein
MGNQRPSQQHSLAIATIGVTIAFGAAAVAGQIVFRSKFGPSAMAAAEGGTVATRATATNEGRQAAPLAVQSGDTTIGETVKSVKESATETAQLAMAVPTKEEIKQQVQDSIDLAKTRAQEAGKAVAQEQWEKAKANTAAAMLEAATTARAAAGEKLASSPITDLKSPEAQRQAQAVGAASVSLWQSLWQVFVSIWQAIVGLFK